MKAATSNEYKILGTRPIRHDGADKVTGKAKYGADVQFANLAHGKILRSPHAHARIKSIDTSSAEKLPGVFEVITANDFPDNCWPSLGRGNTARADILRPSVSGALKSVTAGQGM